MNTEFHPRRHQTDRAAGQGVNATGIALHADRRDLRCDGRSGALLGRARIIGLLIAAAVARDCVTDADGEFLIANKAAEGEASAQVSARRVKVDGRPPLSQFLEQLPEPVGGADIDLALGRNPFAAARPAGIDVAVGQVEFDWGRQRGIRCRGDRSRRLRQLLRNGDRGAADGAGDKDKDEGDRSGGHSRIGLYGAQALAQPCREFTLESYPSSKFDSGGKTAGSGRVNRGLCRHA